MQQLVRVCFRSTSGFYPKVQSSSKVCFVNPQIISSRNAFTTLTKNKVPLQLINKRTFFVNSSEKKQEQYNYASDEVSFKNLIEDPLRASKASLYSFLAFGLAIVGLGYLAPYLFDTNYVKEAIEQTKSEDEQTQIQGYAVLSQMINFFAAQDPTRYSLDAALDRLYKGLCNQYLPQFFSLTSLNALTSTESKTITSKVAENISWSDLASHLDKDDKMNTDLTVKLMNNLAMYEKNAQVLVKRDIVPFLDLLLKSDQAQYMLKLVHVATMLSRNEEAAAALVDEIPQLYLVMQNYSKIPQLYELGQEAIGNIVKSTKLSAEQREKVKQYTQQIPANELQSILNYKRQVIADSEFVEGTKFLFGAMAFGAVYGAIRWGYRKGFNAEMLKVRVPMTMLGVAAFSLLGTAESAIIGHNSEDRSAVQKALMPVVAMAGTVGIWAALNVSPYIIVPSIVPVLVSMSGKYVGDSKDPAGDANWDKVNRKN